MRGLKLNLLLSCLSDAELLELGAVCARAGAGGFNIDQEGRTGVSGLAMTTVDTGIP